MTEKEESEKERNIFSCAFSGHRHLYRDFDAEKLREVVRSCMERGVKKFYCGMAMGFDLAAAECVLALKREYPDATLTACIPCPDQDKNYTFADKRRYARILDVCDEAVLLSDRYYSGCMLRRNDYMEKNADALIVYCRKDTGGSAYTMNLFRRKNKPVFEV